ncbi:MAG: peptidoglycan-binding domain-containing protein [Patescibacteria group bacterium]
MRTRILALVGIFVFSLTLIPSFASATTLPYGDYDEEGPGPTCPNISQTLSYNRRLSNPTEQVLHLQSFLTDYLSLEEDITTGFFGKKTDAYVRQFQSQNGIDATGVVGPITRAKISEACGGTPPPPSGNLSVSVSTDKSVYEPGQTVGITVTAFNGTSQPKTISGGGCNESDAYVSYAILKQGRKINESPGFSCQAYFQDTIPPGGSKSVTVYYITDTYPSSVGPGEYGVTAIFFGFGSGRASFRIAGEDIGNSGFRASPNFGQAPLQVSFYTNISGFRSANPSYFIDYGDNTKPEIANPCYSPLDACSEPGVNIHSYKSAGTYTAELIETEVVYYIQSNDRPTSSAPPALQKTIASVNIQVTGDVNPPDRCPSSSYMPPYCPGGTLIGGGSDSKGCPLPPKCVIPPVVCPLTIMSIACPPGTTYVSGGYGPDKCELPGRCVPTKPLCPPVGLILCSSGTTGISGGYDSNGCELPGKCVPTKPACSVAQTIGCPTGQKPIPGGTNSDGCPLPNRCEIDSSIWSVNTNYSVNSCGSVSVSWQAVNPKPGDVIDLYKNVCTSVTDNSSSCGLEFQNRFPTGGAPNGSTSFSASGDLQIRYYRDEQEVSGARLTPSVQACYDYSSDRGSIDSPRRLMLSNIWSAIFGW